MRFLSAKDFERTSECKNIILFSLLYKPIPMLTLATFKSKHSTKYRQIKKNMDKLYQELVMQQGCLQTLENSMHKFDFLTKFNKVVRLKRRFA